MIGIVYGLSTDVDPRIRYVGITNGPIGERLAEHINGARRGDSYAVHNWIRKHEALGESIVSLCLEEVEGTASDLYAREVALIEHYKTFIRDGGVNSTRGGEGVLGLIWTEERRTKTLESLRVALQNEDYRRRRSDITRKQFDDPVQREKASQAAKKRFEDPLERQKSADRLRDYYLTNGSPLTGKKHTPERSAQMSEIRRGDNRRGHTVWHVRRGITNPECQHCNPDGYQDEINRSQQAVGATMPLSSHTRWHTNRGVVKDGCRYCEERND